MPFRRRPYKKRRRRAAPTNPRPLQLLRKKQPRNQLSRIFNFKRQMVSTLTLNAADPPTGWTATYNQPNVADALTLNYVFALSQIPDYANFTNLFDSYRIKGVRIVGYFSNTVTAPTSNSQSVLYMCPDHLGQTPATDLTEEYFLQRPRSRKKMLTTGESRRPVFDFFMPVTNLSSTYAGAVNTDYTMVKPRFISTTEVDTSYYGMNLRIQRLDGLNWTAHTSNAYPTLKLYTTVYFQMRGINS